MAITMTATFVTMGIDIGKQHDPTALVVAEVQSRPTGRVRHQLTPSGLPSGLEHRCTHFCQAEVEALYVIRYLARLPLGLTYPAIVDTIVRAVEGVHQRSPGAHLWIAVDATGVGAPVVDLLRPRLADRVIAVTLAAGERLEMRGDAARLGKAYLVSRLQVLLQNRQILLPQSDEARALREELANYEIRVDRDGHDTYGALRVGTHDDLVTALGLATLIDPTATGVQFTPNPWE